MTYIQYTLFSVASHRNSCPSAVSSSFHYDMRSRRLRTHRHSAIPFTRDLKSPTTLYPPTVLSNRRHSSPSALYEEAAFTFPVRTSPLTYRYDISGSPGEKHRIRSTSGPSLSESDSCQESYTESMEMSGNDKGSKDSDSLANKGSGGDLKIADLEPINEPGCRTSAFTRIQEADSERVPVLKLDSPPKMKKRDSKRRGSSCEIYTNTCTTGERTESSALTVSESPSIDRQYRDSDTIISTVGVTVTPATSPISNSPPEGFKGFWREFSCESASSRDSSSSNFKQEIAGSHSRSQHPFEQSITIKKKPGGRYETVFDAVLSPSPPSPSPRNSPRTSPLTPPRSPGRRSPQTPRSPIMRFKTGKDKFPELRTSEFGRTSPFEALRSPTFNRSPNSSPPSPAPGVVVTSHRSSRRRSSISSAAVAFAAATAGASVSPAASPTSASRFRFGFNFQFSENMDGHIVTMRVLKILKHWISKQIEVS